jgi:hypothetical protein
MSCIANQYPEKGGVPPGAQREVYMSGEFWVEPIKTAVNYVFE